MPNADQIIAALNYPTSGKLAGNTPIILFGDSLEQHNGSGANSAGSEEFSNWSRGSMNWAQMLLPAGQFLNWFDISRTSKYFYGCNQGISGNELSQMAARTADVTQFTNAKVVVMGGGTNSINSTTALADMKTDFLTCFNAFRAADMRVIILAVPHRDIITVPTAWSSSSSSVASKITKVNAFNTWLQSLADADPNNVKIVRRDYLTADDVDNGLATPACIQSDGVHFTPKGGYNIAVGNATYLGLAAQINALVDPHTEFPAASTSGDLSPNPTLTGTSGTASTGATGSVATSFTVTRESGSTGVSVVASKVTVGDIAYQKLVFTRDGTGGTVAVFTLKSDISTGLPTVGEWYRGWMQFWKEASTTDGFQGISMQCRQQPSTPANSNHYAMKTDTGLLWPNNQLGSEAVPLWQSTPPFVIKAGCQPWVSGAKILFNATITIDNTVAGTDTVYVSRMHLIPRKNPLHSLGI